jgi:nitroimidazol reductase NimA-like FMN-containing flavoprotein (pyridoxamine 5'-phosphate oxidase superfamily)
MLEGTERTPAMAHARELAYDECVRLLHAGVVGRAAVNTPQGPLITPMNYAVVDDALVVATSPYSALGTYGAGSLVAFEVDHFDYEAHTGWSVMIRGRADIVTDTNELRRMRKSWAPRPWADGTRNLHLRIPWAELSGRSLGGDTATPVRRVVSVV